MTGKGSEKLKICSKLTSEFFLQFWNLKKMDEICSVLQFSPATSVQLHIWSFRLILYRLETVDLRRMTNEEKLAFWINIQNALLMHVMFITLL